MPDNPRPALRALADRLGIEDGYVSALDERRVETSDSTRERLAEAMGHDASTEEAAQRALDELGPVSAPRTTAAGSCLSAGERLAGSKSFGIWTNLYSVRSQRNLGFGNLADLRALVHGAARAGAAFVAVNPLHALTHRADGLCPYFPVSRLFRCPLYLDPEPLVERAGSAAVRSALDEQAGVFARLRASESIAPVEVERALYAVLRPVHAHLREGGTSESAAAASRGKLDAELEAFATFQAIADALEPTTRSRDWYDWPEELRDPDSTAVQNFRRRHAAEIDFHAWLQIELAAQLEGVAGTARESGMSIGLYTDLALGSAPGGFDTWWHRELFARGVSLGAPPDAFSRSGQVWGVPPLDPHELRRTDMAFWRKLLDANLHAAGALRIDHALGLRRLFWIPDGRPPSDGAYVRSPEAELFAVLAEASRRHGALLIGEDLGTIPEGFHDAMQRHGLLSSRVLLFERDAEGYRPSADWPEGCLATTNTHDLPPLAGWLEGSDLELRRAVGQISDDSTRDEMVVERQDDREALRRRLVAEGCLEADTSFDDPDAWLRATTRFLCGTPSVLVGLSLDDLGLERTPINVPGVSSTHHPSWTRRMRRDLDELLAEERVRRCLESVPLSRRELG